MRLFSFDPVEGKFGINVQVEEVSSLLSKLKLALKCEWLLMQLLEAAVARREPLPVASIEQATVFSSLQFDQETIQSLQSENEVKHAKKCLEQQSKTITEIVQKMKTAANDVKTIIGRKVNDDSENLEKESLRHEKTSDCQGKEGGQKARR